MRRSYTHSSGSACKYLPFLQQDLFGMCVLVDDDDAVGAHHQRVHLSVFLLQFFEKHMRRMWAAQTQQAADEGKCWEVWGLLRAMCTHLELQTQHKPSEANGQRHTQIQKPSHECAAEASVRGAMQDGAFIQLLQ